jgi:hypothetical protein
MLQNKRKDAQIPNLKISSLVVGHFIGYSGGSSDLAVCFLCTGMVTGARCEWRRISCQSFTVRLKAGIGLF